MKALLDQDVLELNDSDINKLFDIKNYLVSPFNDVNNFLENKYFLTQ